MTKTTQESKPIPHIEHHSTPPLTKKREYGFDLTGFISKEDFSQTLQENNLTSHFHAIKTYHHKTYTDFKTCYIWTNPDRTLILATDHDPFTFYDKEAFAGYMAITGTSVLVKTLVKSIHNHAEFIKEENPKKLSFITIPKEAKWIKAIKHRRDGFKINHTPYPKEKIKPLLIEFTDGESSKIRNAFPHEVTTWNEANEFLTFLQKTFRPAQPLLKTFLTVHYEDGITYKGRYEIYPKKLINLKQHIQLRILFNSGNKRPVNLKTEEEYLNLLYKVIGKETMNKYQYFYDNYEV